MERIDIDKWPDDWKKEGYNHAFVTAVEALRYLARYDRPKEGNSEFNSEHLIQIAGELEFSTSSLYNTIMFDRKPIYVAHIDEVPSLGLTPHEIADEATSEEIVAMWSALKRKYEQKGQEETNHCSEDIIDNITIVKKVYEELFGKPLLNGYDHDQVFKDMITRIKVLKEIENGID
jgi:hypothetical protein